MESRSFEVYTGSFQDVSLYTVIEDFVHINYIFRNSRRGQKQIVPVPDYVFAQGVEIPEFAEFYIGTFWGISVTKTFEHGIESGYMFRGRYRPHMADSGYVITGAELPPLNRNNPLFAEGNATETTHTVTVQPVTLNPLAESPFMDLIPYIGIGFFGILFFIISILLVKNRREATRKRKAKEAWDETYKKIITDADEARKRRGRVQ